MRIPKRVKVGPFTYTVERPVRPLDDDANSLWGQHVPVRQAIIVDATASKDRAEDTFLHECLHAIDGYMKLDLSESQVSRLAPALLMFLRDNRLLRED